MKIAFEVAGTGHPLLLVSGIGQVGKRWRRVVAELQDEYTCVTVDNRGVGATGLPDEPFTVGEMAQDALDTMRDLGHERFFLAGISMGGMISQEIVRIGGSARVRAAVLLATAAGASTAAFGSFATLFAGQDDPRPAWAKLAGPGFYEEHPDVIDEETQLSVDAAVNPMAYLRQGEAIQGWDPPEDSLRASGVPIVVAHGNADPLVPYENGVIVAERAGVDLVTYDGAGHVLESERVKEICDLMRSHFSAH